jgi:cupin fold WbuC family metalloprotein
MKAYSLIDFETADRIYEEAKSSIRKRKNYNFHSSYDEPLQRFLNVFVKGSYVRPHRHLEPPKAEVVMVLEGQMGFFIFDDHGTVRKSVVLGLGPYRSGSPIWGIDVVAGNWHSAIALTERAVCFEAKSGPYSQTTDKEFASWAPAEQDPKVEGYLLSLLKFVDSEKVP